MVRRCVPECWQQKMEGGRKATLAVKLLHTHMGEVAESHVNTSTFTCPAHPMMHQES